MEKYYIYKKNSKNIIGSSFWGNQYNFQKYRNAVVFCIWKKIWV